MGEEVVADASMAKLVQRVALVRQVEVVEHFDKLQPQLMVLEIQNPRGTRVRFLQYLQQRASQGVSTITASSNTPVFPGRPSRASLRIRPPNGNPLPGAGGTNE